MCVCVSVCLSVWPSPIVEPKPINRSRSHSIPTVPLRISLAHFFVFDLPSKYKKDQIENFHFLKNGSNDFHHILWVYCTFEPQQYGTIGFSRKNLRSYKIYCNFLSVAKRSAYTTDQSIFRALLQLSPVRPFHFWPTLKIMVAHIRNKKRSNKHGILQTWSIVSVVNCFSCFSKRDRQERTVNARKYVRYARTFYFFFRLSVLWDSIIPRKSLNPCCNFLCIDPSQIKDTVFWIQGGLLLSLKNI